MKLRLMPFFNINKKIIYFIIFLMAFVHIVVNNKINILFSFLNKVVHKNTMLMQIDIYNVINILKVYFLVRVVNSYDSSVVQYLDILVANTVV